MAANRIREELEALFGEEAVRLAEAQEFLARRYTMKNPIVVRKSLEKFKRLKNLEQQKEFVNTLEKEVQRAFICAMLCGTASQAVLDLATMAIDDKLSGKVVLGGKIIPRGESCTGNKRSR